MTTLISTLLLILLAISAQCNSGYGTLSISEATLSDIQLAFRLNNLTSRSLVEYYIGEIHRLNPLIKSVIELNPDALSQADKADYERKRRAPGSICGNLHGIPILLKDTFATKDKLNTTAGSFALLGSVVPRDAGVVTKLREAGAIILGKASLSEWSGFRSSTAPAGWSARGGQGKNPYLLSEPLCGASTGSAISVAANMITVSLGVETLGSLLCACGQNSVVGIKPTVGLTSRNGVIPVSPRQDTVGPICRTVADAVFVLDAIVGSDYGDSATGEASKYIPKGGYAQFLDLNGLTRKRLGIVRYPFLSFIPDFNKTFESHLQILRQRGAVLVDHLEIANIDEILNPDESGQGLVLEAELKPALDAYFRRLVSSPVRSLEDVVAFNNKHPDLEKTKEYGQDFFQPVPNTTHDQVKAALSNLARLSRQGFEKLMADKKLDALVTPGHYISSVLAIGGFPGIIVPAGYHSNGVPIGICFSGLKGAEPTLIGIAYCFEQATKIRKPPSYKPC